MTSNWQKQIVSDTFALILLNSSTFYDNLRKESTENYKTMTVQWKWWANVWKFEPSIRTVDEPWRNRSESIDHLLLWMSSCIFTIESNGHLNASRQITRSVAKTTKNVAIAVASAHSAILLLWWIIILDIHSCFDIFSAYFFLYSRCYKR